MHDRAPSEAEAPAVRVGKIVAVRRPKAGA
jgi:hypothetical protein